MRVWRPKQILGNGESVLTGGHADPGTTQKGVRVVGWAEGAGAPAQVIGAESVPKVPGLGLLRR